mgnify:CR=1 FL=1
MGWGVGEPVEVAEDVADRPWLLPFFDDLVCTKLGENRFWPMAAKKFLMLKKAKFSKFWSNFSAIFGDEILEQT